MCAEIPDPVITPRLQSRVKRCMMHSNGKCTIKFTKQFAEITTTGNDTYPLYRHRDNNRSVQVNGIGLGCSVQSVFTIEV